MKVMFISDANGHEGRDPYATIIEIEPAVTHEQLKHYEFRQLGVNRRGGNYKEILEELSHAGYTFKEIAEGRWSGMLEHLIYRNEFVMIYYLVSGNY